MYFVDASYFAPDVMPYPEDANDADDLMCMALFYLECVAALEMWVESVLLNIFPTPL